MNKLLFIIITLLLKFQLLILKINEKISPQMKKTKSLEIILFASLHMQELQHEMKKPEVVLPGVHVFEHPLVITPV